VAFEKGQVAFQIIGAWVIEGFKDFPDLDWTIMPLPYFKQRVSPSGSYAWGIGAQSQQRAAAAELLRWLVATDTGIVPIVQTNKLPPARTSAYPKLPFYASLPYSLYAEQLQTTARARPITPAYPVLTAKFAQAVNDIALGAPVKESLDTVARAVDDDIKRHNGYRP
jgi:fructooligosaccharide transport system substrate-binding protein